MRIIQDDADLFSVPLGRISYNDYGIVASVDKFDEGYLIVESRPVFDEKAMKIEAFVNEEDFVCEYEYVECDFVCLVEEGV